MKTALILGAAAVAAYALWRMSKTTVTPGTATGDAVADMTESAAARTAFGPSKVRGIGQPTTRTAVAIGARPSSYANVFADVAARQFAPLTSPAAPAETRYTQVGIRGIGGTAPNGDPGRIGDPAFMSLQRN